MSALNALSSRRRFIIWACTAVAFGAFLIPFTYSEIAGNLPLAPRAILHITIVYVYLVLLVTWPLLSARSIYITFIALLGTTFLNTPPLWHFMAWCTPQSTLQICWANGSGLTLLAITSCVIYVLSATYAVRWLLDRVSWYFSIFIVLVPIVVFNTLLSELPAEVVHPTHGFQTLSLNVPGIWSPLWLWSGSADQLLQSHGPVFWLYLILPRGLIACFAILTFIEIGYQLRKRRAAVVQ